MNATVAERTVGMRAPLARPTNELHALCAFYGLPVEPLLARLGPSLDRYTEWVLARDGFALVTLGDVATLARLGTDADVPLLRDAAARWPDAITGIKVDVSGREAPTLYVRAMRPWAEGVAWLAGHGFPAATVPPARTLYGLGFQGGVVKTYALASDGFVSWRLDRGGVRPERKDYRADVPWTEIAWPDARWRAIGALGSELGFTTAGHVGARSDTGEMKVYVERAGGIPTDRAVA